MSQAKFKLSKDFSSLEIIGSDFNLLALKKLLDILKVLDRKKHINKLDIIGNFDTSLLMQDIFQKKIKMRLMNCYTYYNL